MSLANVPTPYLTISEVAERLRVSSMTVQRLVHAHELASARFGRSCRVPELAPAPEDYLRRTTFYGRPSADQTCKRQQSVVSGVPV